MSDSVPVGRVPHLDVAFPALAVLCLLHPVTRSKHVGLNPLRQRQEGKHGWKSKPGPGRGEQGQAHEIRNALAVTWAAHGRSKRRPERTGAHLVLGLQEARAGPPVLQHGRHDGMQATQVRRTGRLFTRARGRATRAARACACLAQQQCEVPGFTATVPTGDTCENRAALAHRRDGPRESDRGQQSEPACGRPASTVPPWVRGAIIVEPSDVATRGCPTRKLLWPDVEPTPLRAFPRLAVHREGRRPASTVRGSDRAVPDSRVWTRVAGSCVPASGCGAPVCSSRIGQRRRRNA